MKILVIGSFMMDLVVRTPRSPEDGETIIGTSFSRFPGGKGANQAVSAARLGGNVTMAGMVGQDQFGDEMLAALENEQVNTQFVLRDEKSSTGVGLVTVQHDGNNRIIVVPGANLNYSTEDLNGIKNLIKAADILLVQLEMDVTVIEQAVTYASFFQVPVILNPAPAQELNDELLSNLTYLVPNETEAEMLTGIKVQSIKDAEAAAGVLLNKGVKHVVITLAENGCFIADRTGASHVPAFPVKPVDSVAAGDAFNGALSIGIVGGKPLKEAVKFANAAGALTITKKGAIPSIPSLKDVEDFINHYECHRNNANRLKKV